MDLKKYIFLIFGLVVALAVNSYANPGEHNRQARASGNQSHNLIVGARHPGDRELLWEKVVKDSKWLRKVTFEKTFNVSYNYVITQIAAFDQKSNGNGAYAAVIGGGPGFSNVTLRFKSQRGHGINFIVQLYGYNPHNGYGK